MFAFFIYFLLFLANVLHECFALEKIDIHSDREEYSTEDVGQVRENDFVIGHEKDSEDDDGRGPDGGADDIIYPEFPGVHSHGSGDKRHESTGKIMEFPEHYKPRPVFLYLLFQVFEFGFSESKPVPVFLEKYVSIPFSEEIPDGISDDRSNDREQYHPDDICLPEKSTHEKHDLLSRNEHSYDRKRFDNTTTKPDKIIPVSEMVNDSFHPLDEKFDPFGFEESNSSETDDECTEDEIESLKEEMREVSDDFFVHRMDIMKLSQIVCKNREKTRGFSEKQFMELGLAFSWKKIL